MTCCTPPDQTCARPATKVKKPCKAPGVAACQGAWRNLISGFRLGTCIFCLSQAVPRINHLGSSVDSLCGYCCRRYRSPAFSRLPSKVEAPDDESFPPSDGIATLALNLVQKLPEKQGPPRGNPATWSQTTPGSTKIQKTRSTRRGGRRRRSWILLQSALQPNHAAVADAPMQ